MNYSRLHSVRTLLFIGTLSGLLSGSRAWSQTENRVAKVLKEDLGKVASDAAAAKPTVALNPVLPAQLPPFGAPKLAPERVGVFGALQLSAERAFTQNNYALSAELLRQSCAIATDDICQLRYTIALWHLGKQEQAQQQLQSLASSSDTMVAPLVQEALRRLELQAREHEFRDLTVAAAKDVQEARYAAAAERLERAVKLFPERDDAALRWATVLAASGDIARGEEQLGRLAASKDAIIASLAADRLKRTRAVTNPGVVAAEADVAALLSTSVRPGVWSAWKLIADKKTKVEYRIKSDATKQDSFGAPATVQFKNTMAERMELELRVEYTQPEDVAPGPNDYTIVVRLSPGEESREKFIGSVQKIESVKLLRAEVLGGSFVAPGTSATPLKEGDAGSVAADAVARQAKLETLRTQLVADTNRVAAKYRELATKDAARQSAYQQKITMLNGFAQSLQSSVIDSQTNSLLYNPTGLVGSRGNQAFLDTQNTASGRFNAMMRQYNPMGAEIGAYFDVARSMSAYNLEQQKVLGNLETNVQAIAGVVSMFKKKRDPAAEQRQAMARMKARQKYMDRVRTSYETAQKSAIPPANELVSLVLASDVAGVRAILELTPEAERKALVDHHASNGDTPLHTAATAGDLPMLRTLVEFGADVNAMDPEGRTPIYRATETGQADAVVLLTSLGGNPKLIPYGDLSFLRAQADQQGLRDGDTKKMGELASKHEPLGVPAIELAKLRKDKRCVAALEGKYKLPATSKDAEKVNVLAKSGNAPALAKVVEDRNPNTRDELGWTPLHHAVAAGQVEVIDTLVAAKANLTILTRTGRTPLTLAVEKNQPLAVLALVRAGASPKLKDGGGDTALSFAKTLDRAEIALLLMDAETTKK